MYNDYNIKIYKCYYNLYIFYKYHIYIIIMLMQGYINRSMVMQGIHIRYKVCKYAVL